MRTSKKFLAMILTILMVVGSFSAVLSSYAFDDVEDYQSQIALMNQLRIVEGKDETTFGYGEDVLRWHMALWIAKIMTGKVDDAYVNWYETTNYTTFQDINPDQFYGSISYGVENGIILGYSESEFGPDDGIIFQDAFTMVVRMLGYGSASMDANYPWSYVDKAIKLGLDKGLRANYNNEEKATREEIVVILYNALFAPRANGTTFGEAKFNLVMDTVVITGTTRGNMYSDAASPNKIAPSGDSYVAFGILNDDGTVQTTPTYYLPRSAFGTLGDDDLAASLKIGYSYDVVTLNDYTTILYCKENDAVVIDQDGFTGGDKDNRQNLTIDSDAYKAVKSYSKLFSNQGTWTTSDYELLIATFQGTDTAIGGAAYLRDKDLNIIDEKGNILLKFVAYPLTGFPTGIYVVAKDVKGVTVYVDATDADWAAAAKAYQKAFPPKVLSIYQYITDTYVDITCRNAYSDTILFDDDSNGDYDRATYVYYSFGKITKNGDNNLLVDGKALCSDYTKTAYVDVDKYFAGEDYVLEAADVLDQFALYAYNPRLNIFLLKKTYEVKVGYVSTVNKPAATLTFDQVYFGYNQGNITGSTYSIGYKYLPGGTYNSVVANYKDFNTLKGRTVNYILDEKYSAVLRILNYADAAGYIVFKSYINSLNTTGAANVLAYVNSNIASVISIASIDGYTNVTGAQYANRYGPGDLFYGTKDALGMYHLTYIPDNQFDYYAYCTGYSETCNMQYLGLNFTNGVVYNDAQKTVTVELGPDGKLISTTPSHFFDNAAGVAASFGHFSVDKDSIIILANSYPVGGQLVNNGSVPSLEFQASKGIPENGAHISLYDSFDYMDYSPDHCRIFVALNDKNIVKFMYVANGEWDKNYSFNVQTGPYLDSNDTIIFVDEHTDETMVATNQTSTGLGVSIGTVYKYENAIDFIRGGLTSVYTGALYNQRLIPGRFYYVKDGYVVGEVPVAGYNSPVGGGDSGSNVIQVVKVTWLDSFFAAYGNAHGGIGSGPVNPYTTTYGSIIVYELNGTTITYKDGAPENKLDAFKAIVNKPNSYATAYVYVGTEYSCQKRVFITTTYTSGDDLGVVKNLGKVLEYGPSDHPSVVGTKLCYKYRITPEQYAALSDWQRLNNNAWNSGFSHIGSTMKLYCYNHAIADFNYDNVDIETEIAGAGGDLTEYFLHISVKAELGYPLILNYPCASHPNKPLYLVWTNPDNTNHSYKLDLVEIDLEYYPPYNIEVYVNQIEVENFDVAPTLAVPYGEYNLDASLGEITVTIPYNAIVEGDEIFWILTPNKYDTPDDYLANDVFYAAGDTAEIDLDAKTIKIKFPADAYDGEGYETIFLTVYVKDSYGLKVYLNEEIVTEYTSDPEAEGGKYNTFMGDVEITIPCPGIAENDEVYWILTKNQGDNPEHLDAYYAHSTAVIDTAEETVTITFHSYSVNDGADPVYLKVYVTHKYKLEVYVNEEENTTFKTIPQADIEDGKHDTAMGEITVTIDYPGIAANDSVFWILTPFIGDDPDNYLDDPVGYYKDEFNVTADSDTIEIEFYWASAVADIDTTEETITITFESSLVDDGADPVFLKVYVTPNEYELRVYMNDDVLPTEYTSVPSDVGGYYNTDMGSITVKIV